MRTLDTHQHGRMHHALHLSGAPETQVQLIEYARVGLWYLVHQTQEAGAASDLRSFGGLDNTVAAGLALAKTDLSGIQLIVPAAVFVLVASLTVIGPLVAYFLVSDMSAKSTGNMINVDAGNGQAFTR